MNVIGQTVLVGIITRATAWDGEGNPTETETLPGWHANIPAPCPASLESYAVTPANPINIYAEDHPGTVFLKFADEAEGMAALRSAGLLPESED